MRIHCGLISALGAIALAVGCGSGGSSSSNGCAGCAGCCAAGVCQPGTTAAACGSGGAACTVCTGGDVCTGGACATPALGSKCGANGDCGAGNLCAAEVPGGGYCTRTCNPGACPSGGACIDVGAASALCLKSCASPSDCRAEHLCVAAGGGSVCIPKCTGDADCETANCDVATGQCGPSRVGQVCAADGDCGQPPALCDKNAAGGYCSLPCGGNLNAACPPGSNCAARGGGTSVCLLACAGAGGCRAGELCTDTGGGAKSCVPNCTSDATCGTTGRCDVASGACVASGPAAGQLGGACASNPDCAAFASDAVCGGYPGGYCTRPCTAGGGECGTSGVCVDFGGGVLDCLSGCTTRHDCRPDYACFPLQTASVCYPACTQNQDCVQSGTVCDTTSGLCVVPAAGSTTIDTQDLTAGGPITVPTNVLTAVLSVSVPNDAISVTFVGKAISDPTSRVVVYRVKAPDQTVYYDYASTSSIMKVLPPIGPGAFSVLLPNSPTVPFKGGTWTIALLASKQTTATVKALIKKSTVVPLTSGSVDLNLFFVGAPGLSAANAPTNASFQHIVDQVKATWAKIGIGVGQVTYHDITGADLTRFQDLNDQDLGALMQKSDVPGANDNALNVFFVRTISGGTLSGYIILGESAGIPGVPIRGTSGSGMAVTTADFPNGLDAIADTWAHEASHWLGLFHTTESSGTAFDPLADTAECAASTRDANHDGIVVPQECIGFGADNLMFWTSVASIPHSTLTPNQQFVLLRNPAVH
jgi:hypothetical protein